jgi:hypothetical protein
MDVQDLRDARLAKFDPITKSKHRLAPPRVLSVEQTAVEIQWDDDDDGVVGYLVRWRLENEADWHEVSQVVHSRKVRKKNLQTGRGVIFCVKRNVPTSEWSHPSARIFPRSPYTTIYKVLEKLTTAELTVCLKEWKQKSSAKTKEELVARLTVACTDKYNGVLPPVVKRKQEEAAAAKAKEAEDLMANMANKKKKKKVSASSSSSSSSSGDSKKRKGSGLLASFFAPKAKVAKPSLQSAARASAKAHSDDDDDDDDDEDDEDEDEDEDAQRRALYRAAGICEPMDP